jgi:hypothetical protein
MTDRTTNRVEDRVQRNGQRAEAEEVVSEFSKTMLGELSIELPR